MCGSVFDSRHGWEEHLYGGECGRVRREKKRREASPEMDDVAPDNGHDDGGAEPIRFTVALANPPVLLPSSSAGGDGSVVIVPLGNGETIGSEMLDAFDIDEMCKANVKITARFVPDSHLDAEFAKWFGENSGWFSKPDMSTHDSLVQKLRIKFLEKAKLSDASLRAFHSWVRDDLNPLLPEKERLECSSFDAFKRQFDVRSGSVVETIVCTHPKVTFIHRPLLLESSEISEHEGMVFSFTEKTEVNPRTNSHERAIRNWVDGGKMKELCNQIKGPFNAIGVFYDETQVISVSTIVMVLLTILIMQVVDHGNRSMAPIMVYVQNSHEREGQFEVLGHIPQMSDEVLLESGVLKSECSLFRAMLVNKCMRAFLLWGGMIGQQPVRFPVRLNGSIAMGCNVLAIVRADLPARRAVLGQVGFSKPPENRKIGCYAHEVPCTSLNRVVADPSERAYDHNERFVGVWRQLVSQLDDPSTRREAMDKLASYGLQPFVSPVTECKLFNGARDAPEDPTHQVELGLGIFLMENLPNAVRLAFPDTRIQAKAKTAIFVSNVQSSWGLIAIGRGERVSWDANEQPELPPQLKDCVYVRVESSKSVGWIPRAALKVTRHANADFCDALARIDGALTMMGEAYVGCGFRSFDFVSYLDQATKGATIFGRATALELQLFCLPFALASVVPISHSWITETFLVLAKFRYNWGRDVFFESDGPVMEAQRVKLQELMMQHWSRWSSVDLNTAKFHGLNHDVENVKRHAGPAFAGAHQGDHAHIAKVHDRFMLTNRTHEQGSLGLQMMRQGGELRFFSPPRTVVKVRSGGFIGIGKSSVLNPRVVAWVRELRACGWEREACDAPVVALKGLRDHVALLTGLEEDLTQFSARIAVFFHSYRVGDEGKKLYATDSYHEARRHSFAKLRDGTIVRCIALAKFRVLGRPFDMVLAEDQAVEAIPPQLQLLRTPLVSETTTWRWRPIDEVLEPIPALPHGFDKRMRFLIRRKREDALWE